MTKIAQTLRIREITFKPQVGYHCPKCKLENKSLKYLTLIFMTLTTTKIIKVTQMNKKATILGSRGFRLPQKRHFCSSNSI
jgi:hypothetical protein